LIVAITACSTASAQIAGEQPQADTLIVFSSPRPLLETSLQRPKTSAAGIDLLFSGSGWGVGGFFHTKVVEDLTFTAHIGISGKRNTDEFENALLGPTPVVWDKVNRLFMFPVTVGLQQRLFSATLQESFRPFIGFGVGPTMIVSTPYLREDPYEGVRFYEFFSSFADAVTYVRPGGYIGAGAMFGPPNQGSTLGVNIRYYYIPFGGAGIESIRQSPITDFGGVFLSLSIGSAF